jgi:hypothetical protein
MDTPRKKTPAEEAYADIIHRPHHRSPTRPPMSNYDRAAQFSPFAALTGYEAAVTETARLTDQKAELSEDKKQMLDEKLRLLLDMTDHPPAVRITRFLPDERKAGGSYETVTCKVASVDTYEGCVVLTDKRRIPIADISDIEI